MGGMIGEETRDADLTKFLKKYGYMDHDIIVFQEIVDIIRLKENVLQNKFKCRSYFHRDTKHLHVVVCYKPEFTFSRDRDDNYELESVKVGSTRLRPAVHGIIKLRSHELVRIIGVHLKASPQNSERRLRQIEQIASHMDRVDTAIPTVITGDFNSFHDDIEVFSDIFGDFNMSHVPHLDEFTFQSDRYKNQLDHFWASDEISQTSMTDTFNTCSNAGNEGRGVTNRPYFNRRLSDHCPISTVVNLQ